MYKLIEFSNTARELVPQARRSLFGMSQARIHLQSAGKNRNVVRAVVKLYTSHLDHAQAPARCAIFRGNALQQHNSMNDASDLRLRGLIFNIVQQKSRALPVGKKLLKAQHFATEAKWIFSQQA